MIAVITTIQEPTALMRKLDRELARVGATMLVMGDRKGPAGYDLPTADFYSLERQRQLPYKVADLLPVDNYARKNLGYLVAIEKNAPFIYETDDDNGPIDGWDLRSLRCEVQQIERKGWVNVYKIFSDETHIWPRGFPLERIRDDDTWKFFDQDAPVEAMDAPIQQGLHDGNPDADAIWRLVMERDVAFKRRPSIHLKPGCWAPFNSQSTWWWPVAYALTYNPVHCPERMPDIWRGFVAMRCAWELGVGVVYHSPEVFQDRNQHNLLKDFRDEVGGYLNYDRLVGALEELNLQSGEEAVSDNFVRCYEKLVEIDVVGKEELPLVRAWVEDVETARQRAKAG